jgi:azurin
MKTATLLLLLPLASLPAVLTGCSKSGSESGGGSATEAVGADGTRTINLTGNDTLQYNLKEITAAPGEKLHIQLTNIGVMPKQTMSHNFLLLQAMPDAEVNALAMAASTKPPEFLPEDQSKIIARTKMLGPGESETVTFTVPAAPGSYPYLCTFPGHFAVMRGNLVVKAK